MPTKYKRSQNPNRSKQLLWRYIYAKQHIVDAAKSIDLCLNNTDTTQHPFYKSFTTAAIVSYAAPFIVNKKIGQLTGEFEKFINPTLQKFHLNIIDGRNAFYAHIDPTRLAPVRIQISIIPRLESIQLQYSTSHYTKLLKRNELKTFKTLCEFQANRLDEAVATIMPDVISLDEAGYEILQSGNEKIVKEVPFVMPY